MPDMSAADLAALLGTFLAAIISGLGLRRGEAEKRGLPAEEFGAPTGLPADFDAEIRRAILEAVEELRELHASLRSWRRQDEQWRQADADRATDERFEQIEADQAKMFHRLQRMDAVADVARENRSKDPA